MLGTEITVGPGWSAASGLRILDRVTLPDEAGSSGANTESAALAAAYHFLGFGDQYKNETQLNSETSLALTAVWRCVSWIAQSIASLGWHVYQRSEDGRERLPIEDNVSWLLGLQPNREVNAFEWRQCLVKDALTWGNGFAEIERDGFGRPVWLWRVAPDRVDIYRDTDGSLIYEITNNQSKPSSFLRPENVFHLKGLGPDGLVGYSVIEMCRRSLKLGMNTERFGSSFFERGPVPGGILKLPPGAGKLKADRDEVRRSFEELYGGSKNAGRIVVLHGGMEFEAMSLPNTDAQWLESRRFSVEEVCRIFGVPPHKVFDLTRATFSNVEHQSIEAVQDCLLPWCRRLECEADIKLFSRVGQGRKYTRLNLGTLLRGDARTQTDTVSKQVTSGIRTVNEAREFFELNPVKGGDTPLIQGAMAPLDRILEEPAPAAPPPADPVEPGTETGQDQGDGGDDKPAEDVAATFRGLLSDAFADFLRVEEDKARRADKKGQLVQHASNFYASHFDHVLNRVTPLVRGFLFAAGKSGAIADRASGEIADRWCNRSMADLECGVPDWSSRAEATAGREIEFVWEHAKG